MNSAISDAIRISSRWLQYQAYTKEIPGLAFGVFQKEAPPQYFFIGEADVASNKEVTSQTLFRIASISKLFTTVAVLQLVQKQKISLQDSLGKRLPWLASNQQVADLRIETLLSHLSGLSREASTQDYWNNDGFPTFKELKKYAQTTPCVLSPNQTFKYSNFAFGLLGQIIESITQTSYEEYVQKNIFEVLSLTNTHVDITKEAPTLATGYARKFPEEKRASFSAASTKALASATGFASTLKDVSTFMHSLMIQDPRLLSEEMHKEMRRIRWSGEENLLLGLGYQAWNVDNKEIFGHSGAFPGFSTATAFDAELGVGISILTNVIDMCAIDFLQSVYSILYHCLDNYQEYANSSLSNPQEYIGRFTSRWSENYVAVVNKTPLIYNPSLKRPLSKSTRIKKDSSNKAVTEGGSGFGILGEEVSLLKEEGVVTKMKIGSFLTHKKAYLGSTIRNE
ncbi:MAG: serine hydrolase domain-containing protein [Candidatus Woesearchaeota archaeon]